jgi:hypothetical protein
MKLKDNNNPKYKRCFLIIFLGFVNITANNKINDKIANVIIPPVDNRKLLKFIKLGKLAILAKIIANERARYK